MEDRGPWFVLPFAGACALGSAYGLLQGAWPFGVVEAIWAGVALRRRSRIRLSDWQQFFVVFPDRRTSPIRGRSLPKSHPIVANGPLRHW
jgi:hypothetical protein